MIVIARHYRTMNPARVKRILTATSVWTVFETKFRLSAKRTSPFKSAEGGGGAVQSTTGSRGGRISGSNGINAGYTMFRGSVKGTGYPLISPVSPSLALACVAVCHHVSPDAKDALASRRYAGAVTVWYTSGRGMRFLLVHQKRLPFRVWHSGYCRSLLCANMYMLSDEELLVLGTLLVDKKRKDLHSFLFTLTKIILSWIVTISLHFRDASTWLFQEEDEKDKEPWDQSILTFILFCLCICSSHVI
jgi:hypothetical protein